MHMGAFCIENAHTLILIDICLVATRPSLIAIGSHRVATRSGRKTAAISSVKLQLVQYHSCNWSSLAVAISLHVDSTPRFQLIFSQLQLDRL
jgi:hypothetical protein